MPWRYMTSEQRAMKNCKKHVCSRCGATFTCKTKCWYHMDMECPNKGLPREKWVQTAKALALAALLLPLLAGCVLSKPNGNIVSITQSVIGVKIGQNPATQVPEVQIGFFRSTFQIVPTSTNQIYAPAVNSSLSLDQKAFSTQIDEDFTTGGAQAPPDSVAKRGAMSRGKAPMTSMSTAKTNGWPMLPWNKDVPPLHPTR